MTGAIQRSKEIWDQLRDESMEAFKASSVLGVMLNKIHSAVPPLENTSGTGGAIFETQDEKQNAAMTLGLLSSGMSPMSQGPPPFTDPLFKMSDASMPSSMPGPTAEMPGPLSPFSSMFGTMPDMQVNLDWDAWDTYIQNPTFDTSNQFWPMMDPQRQQTPQGVGMTQPPMTSPLGTTRTSSMSNGAPSQRLPNIFSPPGPSPESVTSSVPGFTPMSSQSGNSGRSQGPL
jgi:hypothetical protein